MLQFQSPPSVVTDGLKAWMELLILISAIISTWIGYKVNQILTKKGGVFDRLTELEKFKAVTDTTIADHERRVGSLEHWRNNGGNGKRRY